MKIINCVYGLLQAASCWFGECINTVTLKVGFNQWKLESFLMYRVYKLKIKIVTIYVDGTLSVGDETELIYML